MIDFSDRLNLSSFRAKGKDPAQSKSNLEQKKYPALEH